MAAPVEAVLLVPFPVFLLFLALKGKRSFTFFQDYQIRITGAGTADWGWCCRKIILLSLSMETCLLRLKRKVFKGSVISITLNQINQRKWENQKALPDF